MECFWISNTAAERTHRVLPDGGADIIYTRHAGGSILSFVGPMTRYQDFAQLSGSQSIGVRFRPAMWNDMVRLDGAAATDRTIALDALWGKRAVHLFRRLDATGTDEAQVATLAAALEPTTTRSCLQRAILSLEESAGRVPLSELAGSAGLSERQFRRRCMAATGLSPKLLARILRFRKAQQLLPKHDCFAGLALTCGYFDQSHLIAEFQALSGTTPRRFSTS